MQYYKLITNFWCSLIVGALIVLPKSAFSITDPGSMSEGVLVSQNLGAQVDLNLPFVDAERGLTTLQELVVADKPTIIVPVYYNCPRMCGLILSGIIDFLNATDLKLGTDFSLLTISFNPDETQKDAIEKKGEYLARLKDPEAGKMGWHFTVGSAETIKILMDQLGFRYLKDGADYAHTGMLSILTPTAKVSQYFFGIEFPAWDVRLALIEASGGAIGSIVDQVLLFCFRFDHIQGQYTWAVFSLLRVLGTVTIILVGGLLYVLWRRDLMKSRQRM